MNAVRKGEVKLRGKYLWNRYVLSWECKSKGVIDQQSGDAVVVKQKSKMS